MIVPLLYYHILQQFAKINILQLSYKMKKNITNQYLHSDFIKQISTFYKNPRHRFSRGAAESPTHQFDNLKSKLTQFLSERQPQKNVQYYSQNLQKDKERKTFRQRYWKSLRRKSHDRSQLSGKKHEEEGDIKKMYKKSFNIKEIHPQHQHKLVKDSLISDPQYGKFFGTYYQIVTLQKKYDKSDSPEKTRLLHNLNPLQFKNRYDSKINPQNRFPGKFQPIELKIGNTTDVEIIQPWKNHQQGMVDLQYG